MQEATHRLSLPSRSPQPGKRLLPELIPAGSKPSGNPTIPRLARRNDVHYERGLFVGISQLVLGII